MTKSDRYGKCEEHKVKMQEKIAITKEEEHHYNEHIAEKNAMRNEKKRDKESKDVFLVVFDLENVITLPRAGVECFFYKSKLTLYNLTADTSRKQG